MKALVALTLVLALTTANAGFIDSIKSTFESVKDGVSGVFKSVTPILSQAASGLLEELKKDGAMILSKGVAALAGLGKRDTDLLSNVGQFLQKGESAIEKLTNTIKGLFNGAVAQLSEYAQQLASKELSGNSLVNIIKGIGNVIVNHNNLQGSILKTLIENPAEMLMEAAQHIVGSLSHHKRSIVDTMKDIGSQIASTFTPFISTVTQHITNIGSALKNVGSTLLGAIKPSIDALKGKLSTHVETLKNVGTTLLGHGKNAISALTDAVTDILGQTFKNAQPTIQKAVETAKNAGSVAINHLTSTLTGGN